MTLINLWRRYFEHARSNERICGIKREIGKRKGWTLRHGTPSLDRSQDRCTATTGMLVFPEKKYRSFNTTGLVRPHEADTRRIIVPRQSTRITRAHEGPSDNNIRRLYDARALTHSSGNNALTDATSWASRGLISQSPVRNENFDSKSFHNFACEWTIRTDNWVFDCRIISANCRILIENKTNQFDNAEYVIAVWSLNHETVIICKISRNNALLIYIRLMIIRLPVTRRCFE